MSIVTMCHKVSSNIVFVHVRFSSVSKVEGSANTILLSPGNARMCLQFPYSFGRLFMFLFSELLLPCELVTSRKSCHQQLCSALANTRLWLPLLRQSTSFCLHLFLLLSSFSSIIAFSKKCCHLIMCATHVSLNEPFLVWD